MALFNLGSGDNINGDKIDRQVNMGDDSIYIEKPTFVINKDTKPPRLFTNPPFNADLFIGRTNDLEAIEGQYQEHSRLLVLVNGEGGIGKTTLAAKYWYAHEVRYKHLAWLYADAGIGTALVTLKEKLGVEFGQQDDLATQVRRITEALNNLEAPCLLVLDNANDDVDLKRYYMTLNQLPNCHILLTSRVSQVANMKVHKVLPLTDSDAVELFKNYYPELPDEDLPMLQDVLKAVGYNTLVTEVLSKNMAVINRRGVKYPLAGLLADLQAKGLLALKNKAVTVVYGSDQIREAEPTDIIAAMYDMAKLSEEGRRVLSNLTVLPAENIAFSLLAELLATDEDTLETPLSSLEKKGWLEYRKADNTFKISPVIQEVTRVKNVGRFWVDCQSLVITLIAKLDRDIIHENNYQEAGIAAYYGGYIINSFEAPFQLLNALCDRMGYYYQQVGSLDRALIAYKKKQRIIELLMTVEGNNGELINSLASTLCWLGLIHISLGDLQKALAFFEGYNRLQKELYAALPLSKLCKSGLAISFEKLGFAHSCLGNLEKALAFFEEYNRLQKELYTAYPENEYFKNGMAISYEKLGSVHSSLGDLKKALGLFEEEVKLFKELCVAFPSNVSFKNGLGTAYQYLGSTYYRLCNLDNALESFKKYNELVQELYLTYPLNIYFKNGLAISCQNLGETYSLLGNLNKALCFFEEFNRLEGELFGTYPNNVSFKNGLAISYAKLGDVHGRMGNLDKTFVLWEEYNRLEKELNADYPQNVEFKNCLAISYYKLAEISIAQKDIKKTKAYFQNAEKLWLELVRDAPRDVQYQQLLGQVKEDLAELGDV